MITVLAGGVGAARFLSGLTALVDPDEVTAIVNTGDDVELHGLWICPDLDTVTYTLAGAINPDTGWGLAGETWHTLGALSRYERRRPAGSRAGATWFGLGDQDLATHLYRTARLAEGAPLSTVVREIATAWGVGVQLVPMSDDRVQTMVTIDDGSARTEVGFQDYFVGRHHDVPVAALRFDGAERARPAPGELDALDAAEVVVVAPSNPLVSIGPIRAVPGIEPALQAARERVVAVSPIVAGAALKGPADHMLAELGHESSVVGVARLYAPIVATLVVDVADAGRQEEVEAEGVRCVVAPTIMAGPAEALALARTVVAR